MSQYKPYPTYKDSAVEWLGQVPEHWRVVRMRYVATLNPPVRSDLLENPDQNVSFLPMEAIGEKGSLNLEHARPVTEVRNGYSYFEDGDVAFAKVTPCFENGKGALMQGLQNAAGFGTTELTVLRPNPAAANARYINYIVQGSSFRGFGAGAMTGAGGLKRVPDEFTRNFPVSLPELGEQLVIAAHLDREIARIDALIEKKTSFIELLREKRQALITHTVTKGLDPNVKMKDSGVEWLGEVPEYWDVGVVSRITTRTVVGIAEAATHAYADSGTPILRSTNIRPYKIIGEILHINSDFADDRDTKLIHAGDLVTVRTGNAGVTAVVPPELEGCQCFTMLITTLKAGMHPDYYCYWMNSAAAVHYFSIEGWGTAQVNISVPILKSLPVPIPPSDEQKRVVDFLHRETQRLDMLLAKTDCSVNLLTERRLALITAAVTGQIDLRAAV